MRRALTTKGLKPTLIQRSLVTSTSVSDNEVGLAQLKQAYRVHGHRLADVDPLGIWQRESVESIKALRPDTYGLTSADVSEWNQLTVVL
jgi:2-oxoglutarate dehydrogenase complex dehydrogenase (E1) component-like enzyme